MKDRSEWVDVGYDELDNGHAALIRECVNAIDEADDIRTLPDGRTICTAKWTDADDVRCYLTAYPEIDYTTKSKDIDDRKFITYYYLHRQSSLGVDERYYFSSQPASNRPGTPSIRICDSEKKPVPNKDRAENLKHLRVVLDSLMSRTGRVDTDEPMRYHALDYIVSSGIVQYFIQKMAAPNGITYIPMYRAVQYVLQSEPLLADKYALVEERLEQEVAQVRGAATVEGGESVD